MNLQISESQKIYILLISYCAYISINIFIDSFIIAIKYLLFKHILHLWLVINIFICLIWFVLFLDVAVQTPPYLCAKTPKRNLKVTIKGLRWQVALATAKPTKQEPTTCSFLGFCKNRRSAEATNFRQRTEMEKKVTKSLKFITDWKITTNSFLLL